MRVGESDMTMNGYGFNPLWESSTLNFREPEFSEAPFLIVKSCLMNDEPPCWSLYLVLPILISHNPLK